VKPESAHRTCEGPYQFLADLGTQSIEDLTRDNVQTWTLQRRSRAIRSARKVSRKARRSTVNRYVEQVHDFIRFARGPTIANALVPLDFGDDEDDDILTRILTWDQVHQIQSRLEGDSLTAFVLLTASGLGGREIRHLPREGADYLDELTLLTVPPTPGYPDGRTVALHHGDEVVAARQAMLRRDNPDNPWLLPGKDGGPLEPKILSQRIRRWGKWIDREHLDAEELRLTYICYLLARNDVGENYVAHHGQRTRRPDPKTGQPSQGRA
jgi:integrase